jgi:DNA polymerase II small subunit
VVRDVTGQSTCQGTVEDFTRVFRSRLRTIARLLRQRREFLGAVTLERGKTLTREFAATAIVTDIRTTRNGYRMLTVEDESARADVLIPEGVPAHQEHFLLDEVIGLVAEDKGKGYLVAKAVLRPDVPNRRPPRTIPEEFLVGFLSDVHIGSKTFLEERWSKLLAWMNGGGEVARAVKYLILSGDVVDGIGVYPRQDQELAVDDIYAQYEALARHLQDIPDAVRVIMLPGNHDAVRPAEPQPTFPEAVRKLFDSRVTFVGNPCAFTLHGLRVLAYHGRSMDDWVSGLPGMSYHRPLEVMKEMLRRRHLAPMYGGKTPIAPEAEDYLVIDEVPDVFVTGHTHAVGVEAYRGIQLVNASTWQAQTAFQRMHNIEPSPACLPLLNVHTGQATIQRF